MMTRQSKQELLAAVSPRYRAARGADKQRILDEFVAATGYHRKYAIALLNRPPTPRPRRSRPRAPRYGPAVRDALRQLWQVANGICSKRLVPYLPELIAALERHGELRLLPSVKAQLLALSPATADRLLQADRQRRGRRGLATTKPGTLLRSQIPIRTFADWDDARAGFVEVDLVAHCDDSTHGEYLHTLVLTDIATAWTECLALHNRSQQTVHSAIEQARERLPFPLRGIDSDNGSEFINNQLFRYCQHERITFTRCRPYKKNDQAHVEQKNWSIVRQLVGYARYEGPAAQQQLAALYGVVRLYTNFFQPVMKLVSKERVGANVRKRYDRARTPYQRVLESPDVSEWVKDCLREQYRTLNPRALLEQIGQLQEALWHHARVRFTNEATLPLG